MINLKIKYTFFYCLLLIISTSFIHLYAFNIYYLSTKHIIYSEKVNGIVWIDAIEDLRGNFKTKIASDKILISLNIISNENNNEYVIRINNFRFIDKFLFINATIYSPPLKVLVSYAVNGNITLNLKPVNNSWFLLEIVLTDVRGYISKGISPNFIGYANNLKNKSSLYVGDLPLYFRKLKLKYLINLKNDESYYITGNKLIHLGKFPLIPYSYLVSPKVYCKYLINQTIRQLKHIISQTNYLENIINKIKSVSNKTLESVLLENYTNNIIFESLPQGNYLGYKFKIEVVSNGISIVGEQIINKVSPIMLLNKTHLREINHDLIELLKRNDTRGAERLLSNMLTSINVDELNPDDVKDPIFLDLHWVYPIISRSTRFILPMYLNTTHKIAYLFFSISPPPSEEYHSLKEYINYMLKDLEKTYHTRNFTYKYFPENFTIYFYLNNTVIFGTTFWPVDVNGTDYYNVVIYDNLYQKIYSSNNLWSLYSSNVMSIINKVYELVNDFLISALTYGSNYPGLIEIVKELQKLHDNLEQYFPEIQTLNTTNSMEKKISHNISLVNSTNKNESKQIPTNMYLIYGIIVFILAIILLILHHRTHKRTHP